VLAQLLSQGWTTTAACLVGALALLAGLRRAIQRAELALRDKLVVLLAAGGLTTAGVGARLVERPAEHAEQLVGLAADAAAEHPYAIAGAVVAAALAMIVVALVWWVRFWVRTMLRLAMLASFLAAVASWLVARFLLADWADAWTGLALGGDGWRALLDGGGVATLVLGVLWLLRTPPPHAADHQT
jgi:hypothetical protein